jgi:MOSC domain-containing protein YiiM
MTAMRPPVLLSVNLGLPRNVPWQGKTVYTGICKHPVDGPAMVRRLNIDGDGQGDTNGHCGEQRAVLVYQIQSYRHWQQYFGRDNLSHGSFGGNFTVTGLPDDEVCIGDRYRIGEAEFEVTQPPVTCAVRRRHLLPGPARTPSRRGGARLLRPVRHRHRPGHVTSAMIIRALLGRLRKSDEVRRCRAAPAGQSGRQPGHRPAAGDRRAAQPTNAGRR